MRDDPAGKAFSRNERSAGGSEVRLIVGEEAGHLGRRWVGAGSVDRYRQPRRDLGVKPIMTELLALFVGHERSRFRRSNLGHSSLKAGPSRSEEDQDTRRPNGWQAAQTLYTRSEADDDPQRV